MRFDLLLASDLDLNKIADPGPTRDTRAAMNRYRRTIPTPSTDPAYRTGAFLARPTAARPVDHEDPPAFPGPIEYRSPDSTRAMATDGGPFRGLSGVSAAG